MQSDPVIARDIYDPTEIKGGVEYGKRFVFRHIDFIQYAKAAHFGTLINRAVTQRHLPVAKGICANQGGGIRVQIK